MRHPRIVYIRGGPALCTAAERWDCVPRVHQGGNPRGRDRPCVLCGGRRRHARACSVVAVYGTLLWDMQHST